MIFGITFLGNAQNTETDSGSNHAFEETEMSQTFDSDKDVEPKDEASLGSDVVAPKVSRTKNNEPIKLSIYPNPVHSVWNLRASGYITRISLENTLGQQVYNNAPNTLYWSVDMSHLKAGIYMATVSISGSSTSIKLVKE